jgi:hypothetical protein
MWHNSGNREIRRKILSGNEAMNPLLAVINHNYEIMEARETRA